jgi:hypothetical protein
MNPYFGDDEYDLDEIDKYRTYLLTDGSLARNARVRFSCYHGGLIQLTCRNCWINSWCKNVGLTIMANHNASRSKGVVCFVESDGLLLPGCSM